MATFADMWRELGTSVRVNDDPSLIAWMNRLYTRAHELGVQIPGGFCAGVILKLGQARGLQSDWSVTPPKSDTLKARTTWVLTWCMNGLKPRPGAAAVTYEHCMNITKVWLVDAGV